MNPKTSCAKLQQDVGLVEVHMDGVRGDPFLMCHWLELTRSSIKPYCAAGPTNPSRPAPTAPQIPALE